MTVQEFTRQIGDNVYRTKIFGAVQGRDVFGRLMVAVGPALSSGFEGVATQAPKLLGLLDDFLPRSSLVVKIIAGAKTKESEIPLSEAFDSHFADCYDEMIEFLLFCVEVNFARSIQRFLARGPAIATNVRKTLGLPEKTGSIGSSGESSPTSESA